MIRDVVTVGKALSDPHRIRALAAVSEAGDLCVCQIRELLGLANATVSTHMKILEEAGLVVRTKKGRWVHYAVPPPGKGSRDNVVAAVLDGLEGDKQVADDLRRLPSLRNCDS